MLPKDLLIPTFFLLGRRPVRTQLWDIIEEMLGPVPGVFPQIPRGDGGSRFHEVVATGKFFFTSGRNMKRTKRIEENPRYPRKARSYVVYEGYALL